jgi:hypothetical protein|tara:strand:- start:183 stop:647 length:465 start_codon:yes stop_codon:yes gene_type:complete
MSESTEFYDITNQIRLALEAEPFTNTVSFGLIDRVDLEKLTIFPLAHMIINSSVITEGTISINMSILFADILDVNKKENTDEFIWNDNEQDILNTQMAVAARLLAKLKRGELYKDKYHMQGDGSLEPFYERFENGLVGWALTFDVLVPNTMTSC